MVNVGGYQTQIDYTPMMRGRRGKMGEWEIDIQGKKARLFVRCVGCSEILEVRRRWISPEGHVGGNRGMTCVTCNSCDTHFWPYFVGWKRLRSKEKSMLVRQWNLEG